MGMGSGQTRRWGQTVRSVGTLRFGGSGGRLWPWGETQAQTIALPEKIVKPPRVRGPVQPRPAWAANSLITPHHKKGSRASRARATIPSTIR